MERKRHDAFFQNRDSMERVPFQNRDRMERVPPGDANDDTSWRPHEGPLIACAVLKRDSMERVPFQNRDSMERVGDECRIASVECEEVT